MIKITKKYEKGVLSGRRCNECKENLTKEGIFQTEKKEIVVFKCKHAYHKGCVVE